MRRGVRKINAKVEGMTTTERKEKKKKKEEKQKREGGREGKNIKTTKTKGRYSFFFFSQPMVKNKSSLVSRWPLCMQFTPKLLRPFLCIGAPFSCHPPRWRWMKMKTHPDNFTL